MLVRTLSRSSGDKGKAIPIRNQNEKTENSRHKAVTAFVLSNKGRGQEAFFRVGCDLLVCDCLLHARWD